MISAEDLLVSLWPTPHCRMIHEHQRWSMVQTHHTWISICPRICDAAWSDQTASNYDLRTPVMINPPPYLSKSALSLRSLSTSGVSYH